MSYSGQVFFLLILVLSLKIVQSKKNSPQKVGDFSHECMARKTVFPHIVSAETKYSFLDLEIQRSQYINVRKLFKGGNYMRKFNPNPVFLLFLSNFSLQTTFKN